MQLGSWLAVPAHDWLVVSASCKKCVCFCRWSWNGRESAELRPSKAVVLSWAGHCCPVTVEHAGLKELAGVAKWAGPEGYDKPGPAELAQRRPLPGLLGVAGRDWPGELGPSESLPPQSLARRNRQRDGVRPRLRLRLRLRSSSRGVRTPAILPAADRLLGTKDGAADAASEGAGVLPRQADSSATASPS